MADLDIGTLVGYLTLDDKSFDQGIVKARSKITAFGKDGAKEGADAGTKIGGAAGTSMTNGFTKGGGKLKEKVKNVFGEVKTTALSILGGIGIAKVLLSGWDRLTSIENAKAKLEGLGHSASEVQKIMDNALAAVKGTAFGLDEAATVAATSVAAGIKPGKDLQRQLGLVADAATIAGSSMGDMGSIFNDVAIQGKVTGQTVQSLASRGIPILQFLGRTLGKTQAQVSEMVSKGQIDFKTFEKAMEEGLGGAALKSGDTTSGALKNMGAAFSRFTATLLEQVQPAAKQVFGVIQTSLDIAGSAVGKFFEFINKIPGPLKAGALALGTYITFSKLGVFNKIGAGISAVISKAKNLKTLGVGGVFKGLAKEVGAGGVVGLAVAGITFLGKAFADARPKVIDFSSAIDDNTGKLGDNANAATAAALKAQLLEWNKLGGDVGVYTAAVMGNTDAQKQMVQQFQTLGLEALKQSSSWKKWGDDFEKSGITAEQVVQALTEQAEGHGQAWGNIQAKMDQYFKQLSGGDKYAENAYGGMSHALYDLGKAQRQYNTDVSGMNQQLSDATVQAKAAAGAQDINAQSTSNSAQQQKDYVDSLIKKHDAMVKDTKAVNDANNAIQKKADEDDKSLSKQLKLTAAIGKSADATSKGKKSTDQYTDSWSRMGKQLVVSKDKTDDTRSEVEKMSGALKIFEKTTNDADTKLQFFTLQIDKLSGRTPRWQDAIQAYNDAVRNTADAWEDVKNSVKGGADTLVDANGVVNTATKEGSDLYSKLKDLRSGYDQTVDGAYQMWAQQGKTNKALQEAKAQADKVYDAFIKQAKGFGLSDDKAKALAKQMGILQGKKLTAKQFTMNATDKATPKVNAVNKKKLRGKTATLDMKDNASSKVDAIQKKINNLSGKTVDINLQARANAGQQVAVSHVNLYMAKGGWITGGIPGKDSVPKVLMPGEAVIPTDIAAKNRDLINSMLAGQALNGRHAAAVSSAPAGIQNGPVASAAAPIIRQVHYHITAAPGMSVGALASEVERQTSFKERVN